MFRPYKMRCPQCKTPIAIKKESYIGRKVACKECSAKFVVKAPGNQAGSSKARKSSRKKVRSEVGQDSEFMLALDNLNLSDESQKIKSLPQAPGRKSNVRRMEEREAKKVKKKTEKKKDSISPAVILVGTLFSAAIFGGIGYYAYMNADSLSLGAVEPPKNFTWYTDENKIFSMKFPEGWDVEGGGGTGGKPIWARSKKGYVTISIRDSMSGNAIGSISSAGGGGQVVDDDGNIIVIPDDQKPEAKVHEFNYAKAELKYDDYEETNTRTIKSKMGSVRVSDFTCKTWTGGYSGIRATYLNPRMQLTLYCECPTENFRDMQSAFLRIAQSVTNGRAPTD